MTNRRIAYTGTEEYDELIQETLVAQQIAETLATEKRDRLIEDLPSAPLPSVVAAVAELEILAGERTFAQMMRDALTHQDSFPPMTRVSLYVLNSDVQAGGYAFAREQGYTRAFLQGFKKATKEFFDRP